MYRLSIIRNNVLGKVSINLNKNRLFLDLFYF